jgi:hypothetical protein
VTINLNLPLFSENQTIKAIKKKMTIFSKLSRRTASYNFFLTYNPPLNNRDPISSLPTISKPSFHKETALLNRFTFKEKRLRMILFCISYNSINQQPTRSFSLPGVNIFYVNVLLDHLNNHADETNPDK